MDQIKKILNGLSIILGGMLAIGLFVLMICGFIRGVTEFFEYFDIIFILKFILTIIIELLLLGIFLYSFHNFLQWLDSKF